MNIEKLVGFYSKYKEINISQYSEKISQYVFLYRYNPIVLHTTIFKVARTCHFVVTIVFECKFLSRE